jgi:hypothetical protein
MLIKFQVHPQEMLGPQPGAGIATLELLVLMLDQ